MSTHYYSIKDANRIGTTRDVVKIIMMSTGHSYSSPGIYAYDEQPHTKFLRLTHIAKWEHDMLDAFGVEAISHSQFVSIPGLWKCYA